MFNVKKNVLLVAILSEAVDLPDFYLLPYLVIQYGGIMKRHKIYDHRVHS